MIDPQAHQLFAEKMAQKVAQATMNESLMERRAQVAESRCVELHNLAESRRIKIEELESVIAELRLAQLGETPPQGEPR